MFCCVENRTEQAEPQTAEPQTANVRKMRPKS